MTGSERRGMVLQERDRHLLRELSTLRVADRELIKAVAGFSSTTRVNTRLLSLVRAGLLRRFSMGTAGAGQKYLYSLTRKAAELAGVPFRGPRRRADEPLVADIFIEHQLAINSIFRAVKYQQVPVSGISFARWLSFSDSVVPGLRLIPDGYFELKTEGNSYITAFLEVDLGHENQSVWKQKVERYFQMAASGEYRRWFGRDRFRVLVVANSERRLQALRRTTLAVTDRVFWFATLEAVKGGGLFAPIWLRPTGSERKPLFGDTP